MKSSFLKIGLVIALISIAPMISHGAISGSTSTGGVSTTTQKESILLLDTITVQDDMHILVSFNKSIVPEAVRIHVTKQSDGSNIQVDKITGVINTPESVLIALTDILEEGSTYTLTVVSAISEDGIIIKEGSDALKEFTAPTPLKKSIIVFNAPANPSAVVATGASTDTPTTSSVTKVTNTGATTSPSKTATELPLTGMNPLILLIIAGGLAFILVSRKRA